METRQIWVRTKGGQPMSYVYATCKYPADVEDPLLKSYSAALSEAQVAEGGWDAVVTTWGEVPHPNLFPLDTHGTLSGRKLTVGGIEFDLDEGRGKHTPHGRFVDEAAAVAMAAVTGAPLDVMETLTEKRVGVFGEEQSDPFTGRPFDEVIHPLTGGSVERKVKPQT